MPGIFDDERQQSGKNQPNLFETWRKTALNASSIFERDTPSGTSFPVQFSFSSHAMTETYLSAQPSGSTETFEPLNNGHAINDNAFKCLDKLIHRKKRQVFDL